MDEYEKVQDLLHQLGQEGADDFIQQIKVYQQKQREDERKRKIREEKRKSKEEKKRKDKLIRKEIRQHNQLSKKAILHEEQERKKYEKQQAKYEKTLNAYNRQLSKYLETSDEDTINEYYNKQTYRDNVFICLKNSQIITQNLRYEYVNNLEEIKREYEIKLLNLTDGIKERLSMIRLNYKREKLILSVKNNPCARLFENFCNTLTTIHTSHKDDFKLCINSEYLELIYSCLINVDKIDDYLVKSNYESSEQIDENEIKEVRSLKSEYNSSKDVMESDRIEKIDTLTKAFKMKIQEKENIRNENIRRIKNEPNVQIYVDEEYMQLEEEEKPNCVYMDQEDESNLALSQIDEPIPPLPQPHLYPIPTQ